MRVERKTILNLLMILVLSDQLVSGQEAEGLEKRADSFLQDEIRMDKIPGLAVAVVRDGKIVFEHGYGFANLDLKAEVTPETMFEVGSITKQFTAAAVMMLVEDGEIALDDPINNYLSGLPPPWSRISIRNLLNHTSGVADYTKVPEFGRWKNRPTPPSEILETLSTKPLQFGPGEKHQYVNSNYLILGMIIERVSGKSYKQFLTSRIFDPLGMKSTEINEGKAISALAQGYKQEGGKADHLVNLYGDGSINSSVHDLAVWASALDRETLLKKASLDQIWTAGSLNDGTRFPYGFGWLIFRDKASGQKIVEHGGFTYGFSNFITRPGANKLTVIALTNSDKGYVRFYARGVAALYDPWFKDFWWADENGYRQKTKKGEF